MGRARFEAMKGKSRQKTFGEVNNYSGYHMHNLQF